MVEDESVPAQCSSVPHDRADVDRVVDRLDDDEPPALRGELGDVRAGRPLEEGEDREGKAELLNDPLDRSSASVQRAAERLGDGRDPVGVDERCRRDAPCGEGPLDDEIALCEEQAGTGVVAFVGPARERTFVHPELAEAFVLGVVEHDDAPQSPGGWVSAHVIVSMSS